MMGVTHSIDAPSILVEEGTVPHPTRTGITTLLTLWSLKH